MIEGSSRHVCQFGPEVFLRVVVRPPLPRLVAGASPSAPVGLSSGVATGSGSVVGSSAAGASGGVSTGCSAGLVGGWGDEIASGSIDRRLRSLFARAEVIGPPPQ